MSKENAGASADSKRAMRQTPATQPSWTRQQIIDAAADLIAREGSGKITNRKVADYAGVSLGSTTRHFKSIDELRRAGLAELSTRIEREYDDMFCIVAQEGHGSERLADTINEYLSNPQRVNADAALYAAAIEDPEVRDITKRSFDSFLERCAPYMDIERAKILFAFIEGAVINSCFMGVPYDPEIVRLATRLIIG